PPADPEGRRGRGNGRHRVGSHEYAGAQQRVARIDRARAHRCEAPPRTPRRSGAAGTARERVTGTRRARVEPSRARGRVVTVAVAARARGGLGRIRTGPLLFLLPALLPIAVFSAIPLLEGIYLGFTDAHSGITVDLSPTWLD